MREATYKPNSEGCHILYFIMQESKSTGDGGKLRLVGKIRCQGGEVTSSGSGSRAYRRDSTLGGAKDYISATRVKS